MVLFLRARVVPGARSRLLLEQPADLTLNHVALYVCSCGGYDGNPIGADIRREDDVVVWDSLGYYSDNGSAVAPFSKLQSFCFAWPVYDQELRAVAET